MATSLWPSGYISDDGTDPVIRDDGVTLTTGTYAPTLVCDQGLADKLGIPAQYLRRLREQRPGLYDANVNAWLGGDSRRFLIRCLRKAARAAAANGEPSDLPAQEQADMRVLAGVVTTQ